MKKTYCKKLISITIILFIACLFLSSCSDLLPLQTQPEPEPTPPPPTSTTPPPTTQPATLPDVKITYNYADTGPVQLSTKDVTLKIGQKLILMPAQGLTKSTRFYSSGESFVGDILRQESDTPQSGKVTFTAVKAGKGKLQVIPNNTEKQRAVDLMVTVQ